MEPHPEWVTPRGTTLLEPRDEICGFDLGTWGFSDGGLRPFEENWPKGEWAAKNGTFRLPYAAGIPGELRIIYIPYFNLANARRPPPTVLRLEGGVRYHAYFWEPALGIQIDLGAVERPAAGAIAFEHRPVDGSPISGDAAVDHEGKSLLLIPGIERLDGVVSVHASGDQEVGVVLRYRDPRNFVAAVYSPEEDTFSLTEISAGARRPVLAVASAPGASDKDSVRLSVELRGAVGAVSIEAGEDRVMSEIVAVATPDPGRIGLVVGDPAVRELEIRESPTVVEDEQLETKLYDASGRYRGDLDSPGWEDFGREKHLLLDGYRQERIPFPQDWVLVLERETPASSGEHR
jgi:hypothetical protein